MTNIELPRDAEGHEIPLYTKVLYDKDNKEHRVLNTYSIRTQVTG